MTVLLNGRFREYLETETEKNRLEMRKTRESIRSLALRYEKFEDIRFEELNEREKDALRHFMNYRILVDKDESKDTQETVDEIKFFVKSSGQPSLS
ncbi:hypothetical protein [Candidatus Nanohalococcus occultus]|uniref:hypothetical protein n=1 Tax=Candidatus Nanohalococcus occultus TaxID=2978047 RepID=UPI0039E08F1A